MYRVFTTKTFKQQSRIGGSEGKQLEAVFGQLRENPFVGKQLRYKFFREKRFRENRLYYLVYEDLSIVLVVAFGGKKAQPKTINTVVEEFDQYKALAEKLAKDT